MTPDIVHYLAVSFITDFFDMFLNFGMVFFAVILFRKLSHL